MDLAIGELAKRSGYAVQTLRYYEQIGLMPKPPRTSGGQRRYSEELLCRLLFIRHARNLGFEIDDIRSLLELARRPDQSCASVDAIAKAHLISIDGKIARLTALRAEVNRMLKACAKGRIAQCKVIDVLARHSD
jgi:DNA-binding transcriptional MerR regulator